MSSFGAKFSERQEAAAKARSAMLEKFKARPGPDDPAVQAREAARLAAEAKRQQRIVERKAKREAEQRRLAEEAAARIAEQKRREVEEAARLEELRLQQKVARDARYAARKARRR